jgi:hypothetical protein
VKAERDGSATAHPLDVRSRARLSIETPHATFLANRAFPRRDPSPESPLASRRSSIPDASQNPARPYRQSNLSYTTNGRYDPPLPARPSPAEEKHTPPAPLRADGTESTISTTAPSTVWDELDDLKSRIRRLEVTGKLPASSSAAMSSAIGERPPTATTTVTTMSSSPKRARGPSLSPEASVPGGTEDASLHPLLRAALARSRSLVRGEVYQTLEAAAGDALTLAKMTGSSVPPGSVPTAMDRQLKRKADSLCRSLTELCIAVSDDRTVTALETPASRPGSSSQAMLPRPPKGSGTDDPRFARLGSHEPEPRSGSSARVLSRLEARRSSMLGTAGHLHSPSSPSTRDPFADGRTPTQAGRPSTHAAAAAAATPRTSTVLQRARRATVDDDTIRPLSRAATELSHHRLSVRTPREYTSSHPLPAAAAVSEPVPPTALPPRRSYLARATDPTKPLPATPPSAGLGRRVLERQAPNSADGAVQLSEARQQRMVALGQFGAAGRSIGSLGRRVRAGVGIGAGVGVGVGATGGDEVGDVD